MRRRRTAGRAVAAACLIAPFVALLWVPWYARGQPSLGGVPFFYWYQLLWVPVTVCMRTGAYLILHRRKR